MRFWIKSQDVLIGHLRSGADVRVVSRADRRPDASAVCRADATDAGPLGGPADHALLKLQSSLFQILAPRFQKVRLRWGGKTMHSEPLKALLQC